jgi:lipoprotein-anchoring transpeptidase ErfK/SrfK
VAVTPPGRYRFFRAVDGPDRSPLGVLWRPRYFNGGIAVHGYSSVPPYPASHGCVRVSNAAMNMIWSTGIMPMGRTVLVY